MLILKPLIAIAASIDSELPLDASTVAFVAPWYRACWLHIVVSLDVAVSQALYDEEEEHLQCIKEERQRR